MPLLLLEHRLPWHCSAGEDARLRDAQHPDYDESATAINQLALATATF